MGVKRWIGISIVTAFLGVVSTVFTNCGETQIGQNVAVLGSEFSGLIDGELTVIEATGIAYGYAYDPMNPDKKMRVHFVVDGPEFAGTYLGETIANKTTPGRFSGYYFEFQIPAHYAGGATHSLYVYGHEIRGANRLASSPRNFNYFMPKAQNVYISSGLQNFVNITCNGCHNWTYHSLYQLAPLIVGKLI